MSRPPKFSIDEQQHIVFLYVEERQSAVLIAKKFKTTTTTITSLLKRNNVDIRPKNISISEHWDKFKLEDRYQDYISNVSKKNKNRQFSDEACINMSRSRAKGIAEGRINNRTYGKCKWYKGKYCRSTYEADFLDIVELYGIKDIESCKIYIPYQFENKIKHYIPDFYSPSRRTIFEIKPLSLINLPINKVKFEAAREFCSKHNLEFCIVTERTLVGSKSYSGRESVQYIEKKFGVKND